MMDVTTKDITLVGVIIAGAVSIAGIAMKNQDMAIAGLMVVGTAIGVPVASNKLSSTTSTDVSKVETTAAASEETADEVNNDVSDLAADNSTSTSETTQAATTTDTTQTTSTVTSDEIDAAIATLNKAKNVITPTQGE